MRDEDIKYINDELTPEELREYRQMVASESRVEQDRRLFEAWNSDFEYKTASRSDVAVKAIRKTLDKKIGKNTFRRVVSHSWAYLAVIALVALGLQVFHLKAINNNLTSNEISIVTKLGERVNVTLPDGTVVDLNEKSKLTYRAGDFNKNSRMLTFEGEGYFNVAPNPECPFSIRTQCVDVQVLGTKFYLIDRVSLKQSEIILDEGKVSLTSNFNNVNHVVLVAGQQAKWDFEGNLFIISKEDIKGSKLKETPRLTFLNTDFESVIRTLEANYQVSISYERNRFEKSAFTGNLPATNLPEALGIIEKTYYLSANISGGKVQLVNIPEKN